MGVTFNSSPAIIRSEDTRPKPSFSGGGPTGRNGSIVIDYDCEMAVATLRGNRSDPSYFPGKECFFTQELYEYLCKKRPEPPKRGEVLAITETQDFGLLYLTAGEHKGYGQDAEGKHVFGGIGLRHIYLKRFKKLLYEDYQFSPDGNKDENHGPIAYDPATFLEFNMAALRGEVIDRRPSRTNIEEVLTIFEYNGIKRAASLFINTHTGLVRTIADQGRKEGRKAWKQIV